MDVENLATSLRENSIGTSFTKGVDYFVSTVNQKKLQPSYPYNYVTIIKKAGMSFSPICFLNADTPKEAMANHIALTRAAISLDEGGWNDAAANEYLPAELIGMLDSDKSNLEPTSFKSEYCQLLMQMSGLNYQKKSGGFGFFKKLFG